MPRIQLRAWQRALLAGMICGALVWALSVPLAGTREPFDAASLYYPTAMFLSGVAASLVAPRYWWLAVIGIFLGERLYAFAMLPETRDWLLFGLVINVIVPTWLPAAIGAVVVFLVDRLRSGRGIR
jgi:hypothetical protein